ncbi:MAG TPA: hypothetical protein DC017_06120 [Candidatus Wallbacteria bacterium]|nr:hypothetical protein [Candidatus Wallbacteria bacterium]
MFIRDLSQHRVEALAEFRERGHVVVFFFEFLFGRKFQSEIDLFEEQPDEFRPCDIAQVVV